MLKIAKNGLILPSVRFFSQVPPIRLRPRRGPTGIENFEVPPIKNLEKNPVGPPFCHENYGSTP